MDTASPFMGNLWTAHLDTLCWIRKYILSSLLKAHTPAWRGRTPASKCAPVHHTPFGREVWPEKSDVQREDNAVPSLRSNGPEGWPRLQHRARNAHFARIEGLPRKGHTYCKNLLGTNREGCHLLKNVSSLDRMLNRIWRAALKRASTNRRTA